MVDATNWTRPALRRSTCAQKRRWYSVPSVIATRPTVTATRLPIDAASVSILWPTTSPTPTRPIAMPVHWRASILVGAREDQRGQQGLRGEDQRRDPGRHPEILRVVAPAEIGRVHQQPRHDHVEPRHGPRGHRGFDHATQHPRQTMPNANRNVRNVNGAA